MHCLSLCVRSCDHENIATSRKVAVILTTCLLVPLSTTGACSVQLNSFGPGADDKPCWYRQCPRHAMHTVM